MTAAAALLVTAVGWGLNVALGVRPCRSGRDPADPRRSAPGPAAPGPDEPDARAA